jgi:hypothetical protein
MFADVLLWAREMVAAGWIPADPAWFIVSLHYTLVRPIVATGGDHILIVAGGMLGVFGPSDDPIVTRQGGSPWTPRPYGHVVGAICGVHYAMMWTRSGRYTWGSNDFGELGVGHTDFCPDVEYVSTPQEIISAACGTNHVLTLCAGVMGETACNTQGTMCVMGWGGLMWRSGYKGDDLDGVPVRLPVEHPCAIAASGIFSFILANGRVHMFSYNAHMAMLDMAGCIHITRIWANPRAFTIIGDGMRFEVSLIGRSRVKPDEFRRKYSTEWPPSDGAMAYILSSFGYISTAPGVIETHHDGAHFAVTVTSRGVYRFMELDDLDVTCLYAL